MGLPDCQYSSLFVQSSGVLTKPIAVCASMDMAGAAHSWNLPCA